MLSYNFLRLDHEPISFIKIENTKNFENNHNKNDPIVNFDQNINKNNHINGRSLKIKNMDLMDQIILNQEKIQKNNFPKKMVINSDLNEKLKSIEKIRNKTKIIPSENIQKMVKQAQTRLDMNQYANFNPNNQNFNQNNDQNYQSLDKIENDEIKYKKIALELGKLERIVHIDLKGAAPKVEYFKDFFKMLKDFGATGILLEYEDVFPFTGRLKEAVHGQAYTLKDIELMKKWAVENNLYIIPLVQTYGHLEWILKVKSFAHLRDHQDYPQVITQCLEESYDVIYDMLDQVIDQHKDSLYFHIGLDEVYYKLMHPNCSETLFNNDFTKAFLSHLTKVAAHVREKLPKAKILIWDDMLHNMDENTMEEFKPQISKYEIEPMIWAYMEDVKTWFQPYLYVKYGHIFKNVWAASAYKGASGELTTVTSIKHHYLNHITWIDVILEKHRLGIVNFKGITITGWTRYDHFLALCDLLPEAIPSLIMNLQTMQHGRITPEKKFEIGKKLGCTSDIPWTPEDIFYGQIQCTFPGHEIYEAVLPINTVIKRADESMEFARTYMTPINIHYNYLHKQRAHEVLQKLYGEYYSLTQFMSKFRQAGQTIYKNETIDEWLAVYLVPTLDPVYDMILKIKSQIDTKDWKPRPQIIRLKKYPDFIN